MHTNDEVVVFRRTTAPCSPRTVPPYSACSAAWFVWRCALHSPFCVCVCVLGSRVSVPATAGMSGPQDGRSKLGINLSVVLINVYATVYSRICHIYVCGIRGTSTLHLLQRLVFCLAVTHSLRNSLTGTLLLTHS